jgi:hypothetical protein
MLNDSSYGKNLNSNICTFITKLKILNYTCFNFKCNISGVDQN